MAEVECCGECRFYVHGSRAMYDGSCRRYPPTVALFEPNREEPYALFPSTDFNWWCGEFQRRETEKKT